MPLRYVIHGRIGKTPRRLATELDARALRASDCTFLRPDWNKDLFLVYPNSRRVDNAPSHYVETAKFYYSSKYRQRQLLHGQNVPVVPTYLGDGNWLGELPEGFSGPFVKRPFTHQGGRHFSVLDTLPVSQPTDGYISQLIQKTREFRVLFYRGQHVCTYEKTNPNNIPADLPWNHDNGTRFCTIDRPYADPLRQTNIYLRLIDAPITKNAHLLAYDILWEGPTGACSGKPWVCEVNFCPGITVQRTFDKIKQIENQQSAGA